MPVVPASNPPLLLLLLLPLLLLSCSAIAQRDLKPVAGHSCYCNFTEFDSQLKQLYRPNQNRAEMVFSFVEVVTSLNFKITNYLTEFRRCVRFWLQSSRSCDPDCSCSPGVVCCRNSSLNSLQSSLDTLKLRVRDTFTTYNDIDFLQEYQDVTFNIINFKSNLIDFTRALRVDKTKANEEKYHYTGHFKVFQRRNSLKNFFSRVASNSSVVAKIVGHFSCDTVKVVPFYYNVYGAVLQFLFIDELNRELVSSEDSEPRSRFSEEEEWEAFLQLTDSMTKRVMQCSTKEIYAIRSQEIREKNVAMRNAGIVFSIFLLILVLIIALIAIFACKANSQSGSGVLVRDEPIVTSDESDNRDLLYKRHYEADETV